MYIYRYITCTKTAQWQQYKGKKKTQKNQYLIALGIIGTETNSMDSAPTRNANLPAIPIHHSFSTKTTFSRLRLYICDDELLDFLIFLLNSLTKKIAICPKNVYLYNFVLQLILIKTSKRTIA